MANGGVNIQRPSKLQQAPNQLKSPPRLRRFLPLLMLALVCVLFSQPSAVQASNKTHYLWTDGTQTAWSDWGEAWMPLDTLRGFSTTAYRPIENSLPNANSIRNLQLPSTGSVRRGSADGRGGGSTGDSGARAPGPADPGRPQRSDPRPSDNSRTGDCQNPMTGQPVVIATGEKIKPEADFVSNGLYGLSLARTYRSGYSGAGMFGAHWWPSLVYPKLGLIGCINDPDFGCVPSSVQVWQPDGSNDVYRHVTGTSSPYQYTASGAASGGTLVYDVNLSFTLSRERKTLTYSKTGYLQTVTGPNGHALTYTYSPSVAGQVTAVTNAVGQRATFTWVGSKVATATDPAGSQWTYGYNTNGMLASVSSPGPSPDTRQYHYESAVSSTLLTGISINGVRYSTYGYRSDRKTIQSGLSGGEENDTFQYGSGTTTVTNSRGLATTYAFNSSGGASRVASVSRPAMSTCAASSSTTVYDANGYVDYRLDWNGNKTDFSYDSAGRVTRVENAAGSAVSLTQDNSWNTGINLLESVFRSASGNAFLKGVSTDYSYDGKGNLTSVTQVLPTGNRVSALAYNNNRQLTDLTLPSGVVARYRYNAAMRANQVGNALSEFVQFRSTCPATRRHRARTATPPPSAGQLRWPTPPASSSTPSSATA